MVKALVYDGLQINNCVQLYQPWSASGNSFSAHYSQDQLFSPSCPLSLVHVKMLGMACCLFSFLFMLNSYKNLEEEMKKGQSSFFPLSITTLVTFSYHSLYFLVGLHERAKNNPKHTGVLDWCFRAFYDGTHHYGGLASSFGFLSSSDSFLLACHTQPEKERADPLEQPRNLQRNEGVGQFGITINTHTFTFLL